ncbi:MAG: hypothetical protein ACRDRH_04110 [Pseudonocardia sp.]
MTARGIDGRSAGAPRGWLGRRLLATAGAALALAMVTAAPAAAHAGDPELVSRLTSVSPALPAGVTATLRTTIDDQVVVTNPTTTPLVALDRDGAEFLRISAAGVQGNTASPYFHLTADPSENGDGVPATASARAAPVWVALSTGPTWAWFDPRLSPAYLPVPVGGRQEVTETEELATWSVPLRYGEDPVSLEGALVRRPVTGRFETTLDPPPAGISALIAQGYVPTLSVQAGRGREVTVVGRDGRPYLRFAPDGSEVDRGSATYRDDQLGRGRPVPAADIGWIRLPGSSNTWLDTRLRFPAEDPPAEFADATRPVAVSRWEIPVIVDGVPQVLSGSIRWLPNGRAGGGSPWTAIGLVGGVMVLVVGGAALVLRHRRLRDSTEDITLHEHQPTPAP